MEPIVASSAITVSSDIRSVTDLVMEHQLVPVERSQAEGIVRLVLESAQSLCDDPAPRRVDGVITNVYCNGRYPGRQTVCLQNELGDMNLLTGHSDLPGQDDLTGYLLFLRGRQVALWIQDDHSASRTRPVIVQVNSFGKAS